MSVPAIILAAGASSRLGQPKQRVLFQGETLLNRAIRIAHEACANPVAAVLGADFENIRASIRDKGVMIVFNDSWQQGIASSIKAGLSSVGLSSVGVLILGCDQPYLSAAHLRALLERFETSASRVIVASTYAGVRGMPAIFPQAVFAQLASLEGDKGARALLGAPPVPLEEVEFNRGQIDIDTPDDLAQLT
jgi:molybdenum cofactor cytidylyltransferase